MMAEDRWITAKEISRHFDIEHCKAINTLSYILSEVGEIVCEVKMIPNQIAGRGCPGSDGAGPGGHPGWWVTECLEPARGVAPGGSPHAPNPRELSRRVCRPARCLLASLLRHGGTRA